jgi:RES domain-containing protein
MQAFRIADRRFPVFDGTGAGIVGGRWNSPGRPLIYATQTFSSAMLEVLVHSNLGRIPKTHVVIEINIPDGVFVELLHGLNLAGWDAEDHTSSRHFGDLWLREERSAVLLVPSIITKGREHNVLINPEHREFARISATQPEDVQWDARLFQRKLK